MSTSHGLSRGESRLIEVDVTGAGAEDIEAVYTAKRMVFVRVAQRVVGDLHAANDVVQDAFIQALAKRRDFTGSGSLEGWIWRLVLNGARASLRRTRPTLVDDLDDIPAIATDDEGSPELRRAIASLPDRQRMALFLRYYADLDYRSIAEALDISVGTVSSTLNQAHTALRRILDPEGR